MPFTVAQTSDAVEKLGYAIEPPPTTWLQFVRDREEPMVSLTGTLPYSFRAWWLAGFREQIPASLAIRDAGKSGLLPYLI